MKGVKRGRQSTWDGVEALSTGRGTKQIAFPIWPLPVERELIDNTHSTVSWYIWKDIKDIHFRVYGTHLLWQVVISVYYVCLCTKWHFWFSMWTVHTLPRGSIASTLSQDVQGTQCQVCFVICLDCMQFCAVSTSYLRNLCRHRK